MAFNNKPNPAKPIPVRWDSGAKADPVVDEIMAQRAEMYGMELADQAEAYRDLLLEQAERPWFIRPLWGCGSRAYCLEKAAQWQERADRLREEWQARADRVRGMVRR